MVQPWPRRYHLSRVRVPTYLFWGQEDVLADQADIFATIVPKVSTIKSQPSQLPSDDLVS